MRKITFSSDELDKIFKMYLDENLSQQKIADKFKCSRSVIKRVLKEILLWINEVLNFEVSKLEQRKETKNNSYHIRAGGTLKPFNIVSQLYQDATIYLDRKFESYALLSKSLLQ